MDRVWTVQNIKESSIILEIWIKHRQVVSSKFPKSFRGARDFVVLGELLKVGILPRKITKKLS